MDSQFWIKSWNEGRTGFHQDNFNEKLIEYFPQLHPQEGQKVLVPLCGKTKDLLWLSRLKLKVHGIELHEPAVTDFFRENNLSPVEISQIQDFKNYSHENIAISCGDFFKLNEKDSYDLIYDRAALVALPLPMRKDYARVIKQSLKKAGKYLLIVYEYDPKEMEGPPFSIGAEEIQGLYGDRFTIKLTASETPGREGPRLSSVSSLKQKVYILTPNETILTQ